MTRVSRLLGGAARLLRAAGTRFRAAAAGLSVRRRRTVLVVAAVLAVALVAATAVLHLALVRPHDRLEQARADGLAAARARTEQVLSFTPETLQADLDRAGESVTGEFGDDFRRLLAQFVEPAVKRGVGTRTTVTRAGVVTADEDTVTALLFLNQAATSSAENAERVNRSRVQVTVERIAGQWLISDLRNL